MNQQKLWSTEQCRCCGVLKETDAFHLFEHASKVLTLERLLIFEKLFVLIQRWEVEDEIKELLYQTLISNQNYSPPEYLQHVVDDLESFGIRNLWHSFFLTSVVTIVHNDLVLGRRLVVKLLKFLILQLHCLWI